MDETGARHRRKVFNQLTKHMVNFTTEPNVFAKEVARSWRWRPPGRRLWAYEDPPARGTTGKAGAPARGPAPTKTEGCHVGDGYTCTEFEVWGGSLKDPHVRAYHRRLQFLLLLFIDCASFIDDSDPVWEVLFLVRKRRPAGRTRTPTPVYDVVGYCTVYVRGTCGFVWEGGGGD